MKNQIQNRGFIPRLFIGVGQDNHFFTLRETYEYSDHSNAGELLNYEIRSFHHFNLSQNADEAFAKAGRYATEFGLVLSTASASELVNEMQAIQRADAEELVRREIYRLQVQTEHEAERKQNFDRMVEVVKAGFFPCTKHIGSSFIATDRGYVRWLMGKTDEFETGSIMRIIADELNENFSQLAAPDFNDQFVGDIGQRLTLEVEVMRSYTFFGNFGPVHFVTMRDANGVCVLSKGSFIAEAGEVLKVKATVKKFDNYKGQNQTVVNRVKVI